MKADAYKADLRSDTMTKKLSDMGHYEKEAYHAQMRENLTVGDKVVRICWSPMGPGSVSLRSYTIVRRTATLLVLGGLYGEGASIRVCDGHEVGAPKGDRDSLYAANDQLVLRVREEEAAKAKYHKLSAALEEAIRSSRTEQQLREAVAAALNPPATEETAPNA
jgi:hypothetical protein